MKDESADMVAKAQHQYHNSLYRALFHRIWPLVERTWQQHLIPDRRIHIIGNSHIDAAWLWTVPTTIEKVQVTFEKAIHHMQVYPEFQFAATSPQYYEWMRLFYPETFAAIQKYVREGRWELQGGMWIEPDANIPSGESFIRQRLYGMRFYHEFFGRMPKVEWLLDSFGFSKCLPQIIRKSGGHYFWTTKLKGNKVTRFPFNYFIWQGLDGSQILSSITSGGWGPLMETAKHRYGIRNFRFPKIGNSIYNYQTSVEDYLDSLSENLNPVNIVPYGKGDGGHGPWESEIVEVLLAIQSLPSNYKMSTCHQYFEDLATLQTNLAIWADELYFEYHRGTYTSLSALKHMNRRNEIALFVAEECASMASLQGLEYPIDRFNTAWKLLLFNQFHDILAGTSIPEVYDTTFIEEQQIAEITADIIEKSLQYLYKIPDLTHKITENLPFFVMNPLPHPIEHYIQYPLNQIQLISSEKSEFHLVNSQGVSSPLAIIEKGNQKFACFSVQIPPSTSYFYKIEQGKSNAVNSSLVSYESDDHSLIFIQNGLIKIGVHKTTGALKSLILTESNIEFIKDQGFTLRVYQDRFLREPAWNIDPNYREHELKWPMASEVKILHQSPVLIMLTVRYQFNTSTIILRYSLWARSPYVHIETDLDWYEEETILKAEINTKIFGSEIQANISQGILRSAANPITTWDKARWEKCCHKFVNLNGILESRHVGVAFLSYDKYGYSHTDSSLALTLLRTPKYPDPEDPSQYEVRTEKNRIFEDLGHHFIQFGLMPHTNSLENVWMEAEHYNYVPLVYSGTSLHDITVDNIPNLEFNSWFSIEPATIQFLAVKRHEDSNGLIVRVAEVLGKESHIEVGINLVKFKVCYELDLLEFQKNNPVPIESFSNPQKQRINVILKPFEIKTLLFQ